MSSPAVARIRQLDTHRLIPSKYSEGEESVLVRIADDDDHLRGIFDLDHATDDHLLAENDRLPGIGVDELVFGVPYYRIINAAFSQAHPLGSRFNGPDRGAWYAGFELETSQAEVAWHKSVELAERPRAIVSPGRDRPSQRSSSKKPTFDKRCFAHRFEKIRAGFHLIG